MEPDTDGDEKQTARLSDDLLQQFASRKFPPGFPLPGRRRVPGTGGAR